MEYYRSPRFTVPMYVTNYLSVLSVKCMYVCTNVGMYVQLSVCNVYVCVWGDNPVPCVTLFGPLWLIVALILYEFMILCDDPY